MGVLFCILAFAAAHLGGRSSLGRGIGALLAVGYFYGILRARFLDGATHFAFDCALLGLYLARLTAPSRLAFPATAAGILAWLIALIGWPVVVLAIGFIHPQHVLIQLVGFRAAVWMLPCLWLGASMQVSDLRTVARAVAVLSLAVLPFAIGEYLWGIEPFFPKSPVTEIMYKSKDVVGFSHYRIPATFLASAAYGGVMVAGVPFLFGLLQAARRGSWDRWLAFGGLLAAAYGTFACGSRTPVAHLFLLAVPALYAMRRQGGILALTMILAVAVAVLVARDPRLQRFRTLEDSEKVMTRLQGSAHAGVLDVIGEYPLGVGLGGAVGTSVPSFLAHLAVKQVGAENEYVRIGLELGIVGATLWIAFLVWYFTRTVRPPSPEWRLGLNLMYFYTVITWLTAFIGTGTLMSIPGTVLLFLQMGCVARTAPRAAVAIQPVAVPAAASRSASIAARTSAPTVTQ